jgi:radical SAM superfamily enzyme YgiQ (UPF0313 family)
MKIVFFHPSGFSSDARAQRLHHLACTMPPIGLASIAAVMRQAGHDVTIFDAALFSSVSNEHWAARIAALRPDYAAFSAITASFLDAYDVARRVKEHSSRILTVFGGPHVSWGKDLILSRFPAVDFVIAGEGEFSFRKLADGLPHREIEGLYFRNGPMIEHGPSPAAGGCDMDSLPFPAYDLLRGFPKQYLMPLFTYPRHPGANVISSRGCVYQCSYCDRSVFGRSFRFNSPEYTADLIAKLAADFGVRHINFYDDLFTLNRERVERLCGLLVKGKRRVSFNCIVRLGHIDAGLARLLKSAGCFMVNAGIESGDQAILDKHKCGLTLETIRNDIALIAGAGLYVKGLFMMGFPGETTESIAKTRDFALSLALSAANITAFTPFDDDWVKMDCEHFVFVPHEIGSRQVLESQYRDFIKAFFQRRQMRPFYRAMLFRSPHSYMRLAKHGMTFLSYARTMNRTATVP